MFKSKCKGHDVKNFREIEKLIEFKLSLRKSSFYQSRKF